MRFASILNAFIPRYAFRDVTDISHGFLEQLGLKFIMLDLDNTIAEYKEPTPPDSVSNWVTTLKTHGMELYIVSNSTRIERVESFGKALGAAVMTRARKPSPKGLFRAMDDAGFSAEASALIGDQVFTDMIASNHAGAVSIIVKPRRLTNPFHTIRYVLETPFRAMCRNKRG